MELIEFAKYGVGILVGGGVMRAWFMRAWHLTSIEDLKPTFLTNIEFNAFVRSYEEWKTRVHEDFLQPFREQTRALYEQSAAIAKHAETLEHVRGDMGEIKEQLKELVEHSLQRRASDPPP